MSGASLPTKATAFKGNATDVLIPDEWGKSSDVERAVYEI